MDEYDEFQSPEKDFGNGAHSCFPTLMKEHP